MSFPSKFPHTYNFRTANGSYTQQVSKQGQNEYTVKTWVHEPGKNASCIADEDSLSKAEAKEALGYQSEYAERLFEDHSN